MSMKIPVVSIIMPAFNAERYIGASIDSVLDQTFKEWELIIIDDGSTDKTKDVIATFQKDERIIYIYQENGRQGKARNNGLRMARGEFIAFLDSDDLWHPEKLQKQLKVISETGVSMVISQAQVFEEVNGKNKLGNKIGILLGKRDSTVIMCHLCWSNMIPILTVLVKKSSLEAVGGFSEKSEIQNAEDYHLWLKLANSGVGFFGVDEILALYRVHANQATYGNTQVIRESVAAMNDIELLNHSKSKVLRNLIIMFAVYQIDEDTKMSLAANLISQYKIRDLTSFFMVSILPKFGKGITKSIGYRFINWQRKKMGCPRE